MRILITGATGFLGRRLILQLAERGHDLVVLSRSAEKARSALAVPVKVFEWDGKSAAPAEAFEGVDVVVPLAGEGVAEHRWSDEQKKRIRDSRVFGVRGLLSTIEKLPRKPKAFVAASAIGFYGGCGDEVLTEGSTLGKGFLADVCRDWENEIVKASALGMREVRVRVGVVLGPDGGALAKLIPIFRAGVGGPVSDGTQWMSWIHVDDIVALFVKAIEDDKMKGPYNGVAPEPQTNNTLSSALGKALSRPSLVRTPAFALKLALGEQATLVLDSQRILPERTLASGFTYKYPQLESALEEVCSVKKKFETFLSEQWLPRSVEELFPFYAEARNLEILTPPFLKFKVLGSSTPQIGTGTVIDYQLKLHGIPVRWQTVIDEWQVNRRFVDWQKRGPYSVWHHTHEFVPMKGGTLVRDRVRYRLPLGWLGRLVAGAWVRGDVQKIFDYRRQQLHERFGAA